MEKNPDSKKRYWLLSDGTKVDMDELEAKISRRLQRRLEHEAANEAEETEAADDEPENHVCESWGMWEAKKKKSWGTREEKSELELMREAEIEAQTYINPLHLDDTPRETQIRNRWKEIFRDFYNE